MVWCHYINYVIANIVILYTHFIIPYPSHFIHSFIHFLEDISNFATLNPRWNKGYCIVLYPESEPEHENGHEHKHDNENETKEDKEKEKEDVALQKV